MKRLLNLGGNGSLVLDLALRSWTARSPEADFSALVARSPIGQIYDFTTTTGMWKDSSATQPATTDGDIINRVTQTRGTLSGGTTGRAPVLATYRGRRCLSFNGSAYATGFHSSGSQTRWVSAAAVVFGAVPVSGPPGLRAFYTNSPNTSVVANDTTMALESVPDIATSLIIPVGTPVVLWSAQSDDTLTVGMNHFSVSVPKAPAVMAGGVLGPATKSGTFLDAVRVYAAVHVEAATAFSNRDIAILRQWCARRAGI